MNKSDFENELIDLINRHSIENESDTPDFLLGKYLIGCLTLYASATNARDDWFRGKLPDELRTAESTLALGRSADNRFYRTKTDNEKE